MNKEEIKKILERCFQSYVMAINYTIKVKGEQLQVKDILEIYTKFLAEQGFGIDINIK